MFRRFPDICTALLAAAFLAGATVSPSGAGEPAACTPFQGDAQPCVISSVRRVGEEFVRPREVPELTGPEFHHLVEKDFTVGREAVLFVALCKQQDGTLTYRLLAILYGHSEKPKHLDELCEQIRQAVQSSDPWARRL